MQKKQWIGVLIAVVVLVLIVGFAKVASQEAQGKLRNSGKVKTEANQQIKSGPAKSTESKKPTNSKKSASGEDTSQYAVENEGDQNDASAPKAGEGCTENVTYTQNYDDVTGDIEVLSDGTLQTFSCTMYCTNGVLGGPVCQGQN